MLERFLRLGRKFGPLSARRGIKPVMSTGQIVAGVADPGDRGLEIQGTGIGDPAYNVTTWQLRMNAPSWLGAPSTGHWSLAIGH